MKVSLYIAALTAILATSSTGCNAIKQRIQVPKLAKRSVEPAKPKKTQVSEQDQTDFKIAIARAAEERGDDESAFKIYSQINVDALDRPDVLHRIALLHNRRGSSEQAKDFLERTIALEPSNPDYLCDLAYHHYLKRNWEPAELKLAEAIKIRPDFPRARNIRGMLWARTGKTDEALAEFARAGTPMPEAHSNVALAMLLEENTEQAKHHVRLARSLRSGDQIDERLASIDRTLDTLNIQQVAKQDVQVSVASYRLSDDDQQENVD